MFPNGSFLVRPSGCVRRLNRSSLSFLFCFTCSIAQKIKFIMLHKLPKYVINIIFSFLKMLFLFLASFVALKLRGFKAIII